MRVKWNFTFSYGEAGTGTAKKQGTSQQWDVDYSGLAGTGRTFRWYGDLASIQAEIRRRIGTHPVEFVDTDPAPQTV